MKNNENEPYVPGTERALDESNRGYRLLRQMGWRSGFGLGKHEQGIVEPIKMKENLVHLGLGKAEEYDKVTHLTTSVRRKMDAEVQETIEEIACREAKGAKKEQLKEEVKIMQAAFYCCDCRKQYKSVTEMENHLSSYDHHHTKRLKELQYQKRRVGTQEKQSVMREKEHEMERLMLQRRIAAQKQVTHQPTNKIKSITAVKKNSENSLIITKSGFGMKFGTKKLAKKTLVGCSATQAFSNPFEQ
ncbi:unnamed protein product [Peronospora farinosa]|uniref:G-patch domain-containing protein n=1 Tax=Peronospora farinosa TaxID=134698 RepID=A0AAV0STC1_9STRA|nr:unnamed protein product [Peronospora farinosa]CAI5707828.1 unnamed protein product [Peronospora farinosa]